MHKGGHFYWKITSVTSNEHIEIWSRVYFMVFFLHIYEALSAGPVT